MLTHSNCASVRPLTASPLSPYSGGVPNGLRRPNRFRLVPTPFVYPRLNDLADLWDKVNPVIFRAAMPPKQTADSRKETVLKKRLAAAKRDLAVQERNAEFPEAAIKLDSRRRKRLSEVSSINEELKYLRASKVPEKSKQDMEDEEQLKALIRDHRGKVPDLSSLRSNKQIYLSHLPQELFDSLLLLYAAWINAHA